MKEGKKKKGREEQREGKKRGWKRDEKERQKAWLTFS